MARLHLAFFVDEPVVPELAALRHRWDPVMAAVVPPHVTLVYPREFDDTELLRERAAAAAAQAACFTMTGRSIVAEADGRGGVFLELDDDDGSWSQLRDAILMPPFGAAAGPPHLTIVHPRTSSLGPQAWTELHDWDGTVTLSLTEFILTAAHDDESKVILDHFALQGERSA